MLKGMPIPLPDLDTQPFWDGCASGRFLVPRCRICGATRWPPGPMCPVCQSTETDWIESSGQGTLYSWIVVVHPIDPVLVDQVPYVVALIALEEGVRVVGNLSGCSPDELAAEMPVELVFEESAAIRLPNFRCKPGAPDPVPPLD